MYKAHTATVLAWPAALAHSTLSHSLQGGHHIQNTGSTETERQRWISGHRTFRGNTVLADWGRKERRLLSVTRVAHFKCC